MKPLVICVIAAIFSFAFIVPDSNNALPQQEKPKWVVPDASKKVKNPIAANAESIAAGKELYSKHCKSCHGASGKGDGPKAAELDDPIGDFTEASFTSQTDGELFYKTKEGRDDMPSFKKKITDDEDFWNIINYVRTLNKK